MSIANNFGIGKTPDELDGLTLPEKLLISIYRPKMYVTTLRSFAGPGTLKTCLKGNTITFPQDIVKIAEVLSANPDILGDHLKVVFIGNGAPSRELLRKVIKVRRDKVYNALRCLISNHPLYANEVLSVVNLPVDDISKQLVNTLRSFACRQTVLLGSII